MAKRPGLGLHGWGEWSLGVALGSGAFLRVEEGAGAGEGGFGCGN